MKKHVSLSGASLEKVYDWAVANAESPLGRTYLAACAVVDLSNPHGIAAQLDRTRPECNGTATFKKRWHEARAPQEQAFILRDTVGRYILEMLKRQAAQAAP